MADAVVAAAVERRYHRLTIDATLQRSLEELARERARVLGPDISVAILAIDHAGGEAVARRVGGLRKGRPGGVGLGHMYLFSRRSRT